MLAHSPGECSIVSFQRGKTRTFTVFLLAQMFDLVVYSPLYKLVWNISISTPPPFFPSAKHCVASWYEMRYINKVWLIEFEKWKTVYMSPWIKALAKQNRWINYLVFTPTLNPSPPPSILHSVYAWPVFPFNLPFPTSCLFLFVSTSTTIYLLTNLLKTLPHIIHFSCMRSKQM